MILFHDEDPHKPEPQAIDPELVPVEAYGLWDGLNLALPFWDHGQLTLEDVSGNNLHGAFLAGLLASDWAGSTLGSALHFTGSANARVDIADPTADLLDNTSKLSVELWICFDTTAVGRQTLAGKYYASTGKRSWSIFLEYDDQLRMLLSSDGTNFEEQKTTSFSPANDTWYHVVFTFDSGTFKVYVDGVSLAVDGDFTTETSIYGGTEDLHLGWYRTTDGSYVYPFRGYMGSFRVWHGRVLTAGEVEYLHRNPWVVYAQPWPFLLGGVEHTGSTPAGPWIYHGEVVAGVQAYRVDDLVNGTSYDLKVTTVDDSDNESTGATLVPAGTPTAPAATPIEIFREPLHAPAQIPPWTRPYR